MKKSEIITPGEFQEICDQAVLAVDLEGRAVAAMPYDLASAVITEIHMRVCQHLGITYEGKQPMPPNEIRIEEIVKVVSRHWTGPILVGRTINEAVRMVLEHRGKGIPLNDEISTGGTTKQ